MGVTVGFSNGKATSCEPERERERERESRTGLHTDRGTDRQTERERGVPRSVSVVLEDSWPHGVSFSG